MYPMLLVLSVAASLVCTGQSAGDCTLQPEAGVTAGASFVQAVVQRGKVPVDSEWMQDASVDPESTQDDPVDSESAADDAVDPDATEDVPVDPEKTEDDLADHTTTEDDSVGSEVTEDDLVDPEPTDPESAEDDPVDSDSTEDDPVDSTWTLDDCGCVPGWTGWSSRARRCSRHSRTSAAEAAACRSRRGARVDDCGCVPGRTGWSSRARRCSRHSRTSAAEAAACRSRKATPAPTRSPAVPSPPPPGKDSGKLRLMAWNVYFGNHNIEAMAKMLQRYNVDIANLQETNNRLGSIARASGFVSANTWRSAHDWCGYNFHRGDWNHSWSKEVEVPGHRGVCGALMQRGDSKLCVWGLHPIQRNNNVRYSKESIKLAADEMKSCSSRFGAPSIFMGDFNTMDWRGVRWQLEQSTGWRWSLAARNHIDFIFIQTAPLSVGRVTSSKVVGRGCIPGFPGHNKRTSSCGWSDHSPVYAEIQLR